MAGLSLLQPRDIEEVADQSAQPAHGVELFFQLLANLFRGVAGQQLFMAEHQDGQRTLQFVGGIADELFLLGERILQAIEHPVERGRQDVQLIATVAQRDPPVERMFTDHPDMVVDRRYRPQQPSRQEITGQKDQDDGDADTPGNP